MTKKLNNVENMINDMVDVDDWVVHEKVNEGIALVDQAIDRFLVENIGSLQDDESSTWRHLIGALSNDVSRRYEDLTVIERVQAYIVDRVFARRSEVPYFTRPRAMQFIREHKKLPEGPEWLAYLTTQPSQRVYLECLLGVCPPH